MKLIATNGINNCVADRQGQNDDPAVANTLLNKGAFTIKRMSNIRSAPYTPTSLAGLALCLLCASAGVAQSSKSSPTTNPIGTKSRTGS